MAIYRGKTSTIYEGALRDMGKAGKEREGGEGGWESPYKSPILNLPLIARRDKWAQMHSTCLVGRAVF